MPRPPIPDLTPYTQQLPDVNNPATWADRTPPFWNWVTGPGYTNLSDLVTYSEDAIDYVDTALAGSETLIDAVAALDAELSGKQPLDADLTAVAGLTTTGLVARTGAGTAASRSIAATGLATVTNGDAIAGNPTVGVPAASQAEAEAGTNNTKVMTPLRVIQSIAANTPEGYTDAQARAAQAGHAAGGVGSYAFMRYTATTGNNTQISLEMNSTVAGSLLRYSGADVDANSNEVVNIVDSGVIPVGTWRLMGHFFYGISSSVRNQGPRYSLWLRIL